MTPVLVVGVRPHPSIANTSTLETTFKASILDLATILKCYLPVTNDLARPGASHTSLINLGSCAFFLLTYSQNLISIINTSLSCVQNEQEKPAFSV